MNYLLKYFPERIAGDHAKVVFPAPADQAAASVSKLKSMGVKSVVFDPCGNVPDQGDFLSVMRRNVENLKMAFQ